MHSFLFNVNMLCVFNYKPDFCDPNQEIIVFYFFDEVLLNNNLLLLINNEEVFIKAVKLTLTKILVLVLYLIIAKNLSKDLVPLFSMEF